jgi:hypothetical protein
MFAAAVPAEGMLGGLCDVSIVLPGFPDHFINAVYLWQYMMVKDESRESHEFL